MMLRREPVSSAAGAAAGSPRPPLRGRVEPGCGSVAPGCGNVARFGATLKGDIAKEPALRDIAKDPKVRPPPTVSMGLGCGWLGCTLNDCSVASCLLLREDTGMGESAAVVKLWVSRERGDRRDEAGAPPCELRTALVASSDTPGPQLAVMLSLIHI